MAEEDKVKNLINLLSKYIFDEKIDIIDNLDSLKENLQRYMKTNSAKELVHLKSLLHSTSEHGLQLIKLECGNFHCHDCYFLFVQENSWNPELTCEHGKKITPLFKKKIFENEVRLNSLKRLCVGCEISQDKMNFPLLSSHDCMLCVDCITENFDMKAEENLCRLCHNAYSQDCDSIIRTIIESGLDDNEIFEIYVKPCKICQEKKDSRLFERYCVSQCKACTNCVKKILKEQKMCNVCNQEISIN